MILNNLVKKLIDLLPAYSDKKVYIQLCNVDDYDLDKCRNYRFNITHIAEGGHVGSEEYTMITGNMKAWTEIDVDWIKPTDNDIQNGNKFGRCIDKFTKRKMIIKGDNNGCNQSK